MSEIKNGGLDQYGAGPVERQQFGTAGVEGVKRCQRRSTSTVLDLTEQRATHVHRHVHLVADWTTL